MRVIPGHGILDGVNTASAPNAGPPHAPARPAHVVILTLLVAVSAMSCGHAQRAGESGPPDKIEQPAELGQPQTVTPSSGPQLQKRDLVTVPGGRFLQEAVNGEAFEHEISSFRLGKYLVTYELWYAVRRWALESGRGYHFTTPGREGSHGSERAPPSQAGRQPVAQINWYNAIVWLNAYSEMSGLEPVYTLGGEPARDAGADADAAGGEALNAVAFNREADGYRLPTEGEWQYAASWRGTGGPDADEDRSEPRGLIEFGGRYWTPPSWASGARADHTDEEATSEVAWYLANSDRTDSEHTEGHRTQPVGTRTPNHLGIYDMSGNLWEWVWDRYAPYPDGPQRDYHGPKAPVGENPYRVLRGASATGTAELLQVGFRIGFDPAESEFNGGIRVAKCE